MKRSFVISLLFLLLLALPAKAQYYSIGDDPGSLKWNSLQSRHYKVIYPTALDSLARVYLLAFEKYRNVTDAGLGVSSADIPLVLHPYTSISNASVAWAPKRVDILTTPPYNRPYTNGWPKMLALHEGRHVTQMTHFTRGFWGGVAYVLGEQAAGAGIGIHTSGWFREGDAVDNETDWTNAGRGRNAS
ncbi:MAG: hypothetical protein HUJ90_05470, partial [Bacteroidales bacterium]|nr:hypothetical protein [Bacteroidales bacterium]